MASSDSMADAKDASKQQPWMVNAIGSIKWWALRHRLHHRYTDTDFDPYNAKRGFLFSHIGWIFEKPHYDRIKLVDQSDLQSDPVVVFQHKHFPLLAMISSLVIPTLIATFCWKESWVTALLYAGFVKTIFVWHATFCINSLAHALGEQEFSLDCTARGGLLLALITMGEGYHNYHHSFPKDVRNGIKWYQYDPTKWVIFLLSYFGLTYNLHTATDEEIERERIHVLEHLIEERRKAVTWGMPERDMDIFTMDQVQSCREDGRELFVIDGFVIDVSSFKHEHPGGPKYISSLIGRDATHSFYGKLNNHTTAAHTLLRSLAIGKIPLKRCESLSTSKEE
ncbi:hypothetical protein SmJEL517_g05571 [Synchytrium microbalum]|uniref:Cytochrome b5 heme-binding domain-containing protein n=1 Tax=Synchytrium microbalum TaxID=1806994 RepID=A0A507BTS9_9FUNG|nr:uncharacterized protein SmJEL517_g05571 [Synchytrium microbalum]TPX30992.1 hypothetical protein SmJEL517_g05571 [Synchytrium microbalum]